MPNNSNNSFESGHSHGEEVAQHNAAGGSRSPDQQSPTGTVCSVSNSQFEWNAPLLLFVFGFIGIGAAAMGIAHGIYIWNLVSGAQRVEGAVVGYVEEYTDRSSSSETINLAVVEYSIADERYRIRTNGDMNWRVGRKMPVLVRPDRPADGVVDSFEETWMVTLIGCVIGFPFLSYATIGFVMRRRSSTTQRDSRAAAGAKTIEARHDGN